MSISELFLIALGLSMDAFAAAICKGLEMKGKNLAGSLKVALFFGFFQALMPLLGWLLGTGFGEYISEADHWVAFGLLAFIGGRMIYEALTGEEQEPVGKGPDLKELILLSVATSIDAMAVGIAFAILPEVDIWGSIGVIGLTTFVLSLLGTALGARFGARYKDKAELFGGVVLVFIGVKILLEHLGVI